MKEVIKHYKQPNREVFIYKEFGKMYAVSKCSWATTTIYILNDDRRVIKEDKIAEKVFKELSKNESKL